MNPYKRPLTLWLGLSCAMIFLMCVIGAVTRLTESGLSITRWEPVRGILPPLDAAAWDNAFSLYKATPQYAAINQGMTLENFKGIYFWEWLHRLWGRLIGIVFAVPLFFFWLKGAIPAGFKKPLLVIFALGGLQGFIGWFMVQSGLEAGRVSVSALRLAMHLGMALFIYCLILWQILRLHADKWRLNLPYQWCLHRHTLFALLFLVLTMLWGAFTAGLDAGKIYNSFPLMDGHIMPPDFAAIDPFFRNIYENPATVQFIHRCLASITVLLIATLAWRMRGIRKPLAIALGHIILLQFVLGIITVLSGAMPLPAALHQANAILALSGVVMVLFLVRQKT